MKRFEFEGKEDEEKVNNEKVEERKWFLRLDKPLRKGDLVEINAYTKEYIVYLKEDEDFIEGKSASHMELLVVTFLDDTWIPIKKIN